MIKNFNYLQILEPIKKKLENKFTSVLNSGNLILGPNVKKFEKDFSKYLGVKYGLGVGNCTDAIFIALKAFDIGPGDEVITVSNTAIPTITAIVNTGASPVFVDVDKNYLMDVNHIEKKINKKTKAILPVHLYGNVCDMKKILSISKKYNLKVVEDSAQATGSSYNGKKAGSIGDIGCHSFYPTKILGGFGDGGFISTNNKNLYIKMKKIRFMGIDSNQNYKYYLNYYNASIHGTNSRLDEIHASLLSVKLKKLSLYIKTRQKNAKLYDYYLKGLDLILPEKNSNTVLYEYVVRHKKRNLILDYLKNQNIFLKITYPIPIHKMKPYKKYLHKNLDLRNTEKFAKEIFSLPVYPGIKLIEIKKICKNLRDVLIKQ